MNIDSFFFWMPVAFGLIMLLLILIMFLVKLKKARRLVLFSDLPVIDEKTGDFLVERKTMNQEAFQFLWQTSGFLFLFFLVMGLTDETTYGSVVNFSLSGVGLALLLVALLFYTITIGFRISYDETWMIVKSFWKKERTLMLTDIIESHSRDASLMLVDRFGRSIRLSRFDDGFRHFCGLLSTKVATVVAKTIIAVSYSVRPLTYYPNQNESVTCDVAAFRVLPMIQPDCLVEIRIRIPIDNEEVFKEDGYVNNMINGINDIHDYSIHFDFLCVGYTVNLFERLIRVYFYGKETQKEELVELVTEDFEANGIDGSSLEVFVSGDPGYLKYFELIPNDYHFEYMVSAFKLEMLGREMDLSDSRDVYVRFFFEEKGFYQKAIRDLSRLSLTVVEEKENLVPNEKKTYVGIVYEYSVIMKKKMVLSSREINALTDNLVATLIEHHGIFGCWSISEEEIREDYDIELNKKVI